MSERESLGESRCTGFGDCACERCYPPEPEYPLAGEWRIVGFWHSLWRVLCGERIGVYE
jgi:hypothetical protein